MILIGPWNKHQFEIFLRLQTFKIYKTKGSYHTFYTHTTLYPLYFVSSESMTVFSIYGLKCTSYLVTHDNFGDIDINHATNKCHKVQVEYYFKLEYI